VPDTIANKSAPTSQPESAPKDRYKAAFTEIAKAHAAEGLVIVCVSHSDGIDAFRKAFGCKQALPKPPDLCATVAVELGFDPEGKV
jgi:broad specificity phosphatase PhoE